MYVTETLKRAYERVTGRGKPTTRQVRAAVARRRPKTFMFRDDGTIPNNPDVPVLFYPQVVDLARADDPAAVFEQLFAANDWDDSWRNGIYDYVHYHSAIHEALGIARGRARVRLGGDKGEEVDLAAGDVVVLPAGTGHQCLMQSEDFLVVGAYPPSGEYDLCRGSKDEHEKALAAIPLVPPPNFDPVYGKSGPLTKHWRDALAHKPSRQPSRPGGKGRDKLSS
jgi:uncharacterized protein YjlB